MADKPLPMPQDEFDLARKVAEETGLARPIVEAQASVRLILAEDKLAAAERELSELRAALRRHTHSFTDPKGGGELCGGCLEPSPCPDAALLGEEAGRG